MNIEPWLGIAGILLTSIATVAAGKITTRSSLRVGQEANAVTFSRDLIGRVEGLEDDVRELRKELDALKKVLGVAVTFIERFLAWVHAGARKPAPGIPRMLKPFLDDTIIASHEHYLREQQTDGSPQ